MRIIDETKRHPVQLTTVDQIGSGELFKYRDGIYISEYISNDTYYCIQLNTGISCILLNDTKVQRIKTELTVSPYPTKKIIVEEHFVREVEFEIPENVPESTAIQNAIDIINAEGHNKNINIILK